MNSEASAKASGLLLKEVFAPNVDKLTRCETLSDPENKTIEFIAKEHSKDGMQWGGCMQHRATAELVKDDASKLELMNAIAEQLKPENVMGMEDVDQLAQVMKAITDCSYCYIEYIAPAKKPEDTRVNQLKTMVSPTPEELAIRVKATELGKPSLVATSYGISRDGPFDLAPKAL
jgi:hypothetical protein